MATDLKTSWFQSIQTGNLSTLSRLLYSTPNPLAGIDRLNWTWTADSSSSFSKTFDKCSDICLKLGHSADNSNNEVVNDLWALPFAILVWYQNGKTKALVDIIKIICSICPASMINKPFDNNNNTVLHLAAVIGNLEIIRMVLDKKPNPTLVNGSGKSALDIASLLGRNMMQDYSNRYHPVPAAVTSPAVDSPVQSPAVLKQSDSTVVANQTVDDEDELKRLGIDLNDTEVESIAQQLLLTRSKSQSKPNTKPEAAVDPPSSPAVPAAAPKLPQSAQLAQTPAAVTIRKKPESKQSVDSDIKVVVGASSTLLTKRPPTFTSAALQPSSAVAPALATDPSHPPPHKVTRKPLNLTTTPIKPTEQTIVTAPPVQIDRNDIISTAGSSTEKKDDVNTSRVNTPVNDGYNKQVKQELILMDKDYREDSSPKKNVLFKNSWRGELEKTRKFFVDAATVSISSQHSSNLGRPTLSETTFINPSAQKPSQTHLDFGKLFVHVKSIRGVVVNMSKMADSSFFYCTIRTSNSDTILMTKPVRFGQENMYTTIPIGEEFAFPTDGKHFDLTITLRVRLEFEKNPRKLKSSSLLFRTGSFRELFKGSSNNGRSSSRVASRLQQRQMEDVLIHEEAIASITIPSESLGSQLACDNKPVDIKTNWNPINIPSHLVSVSEGFQRSSSRASFSSILASKIWNKNSTNNSDSNAVEVQVSEAGNVSIQLYQIAGLKDEIEQKMVPNAITPALDWLNRKQWHETCWMTGYLSQQGGDVKFWRRRYFQIVGSKMLAHSEFSHEYRTAIDLSQLVDIDLIQGEVDCESYPTVNSFRLTFKHGEKIDFYADSKSSADEWILKIRETVKNIPDSPDWIGDSSQSSCFQSTVLQSSRNSSSSKIASSTKRRSPKKLSIDESRVSMNDDGDYGSYKSYDKRYKTPAANKGISLVSSAQQQQQQTKLSLSSKFDDDYYDGDEDDGNYDKDFDFSFDGKQSQQSSFVGLFGTQKGRSIPQL